MKRILTILTTLSTVSLFAMPARASFGDFLLGAGVATGAAVVINSNRRADAASRAAPPTPEQEFFRGVQDGTNRARYDNPRNSPDYDRGFQKGLERSFNN
jgi:hypothetical protein